MNLEIDDPILNVAVEAAQVGGAICRQYFEQELLVSDKDVGNLVTQADIESEAAIVATIQQHFPDHQVLGEENQKADLDADRLWIVDPLDGTNNFAHRIPHFAISIAYWERGEPTVGVIYNPVREDFYYARKGRGAYSRRSPLRVSQATQLSSCLIGCGFYYDRGEMMRATLRAIESCFEKNIHGIRRFGTASLDLVQVASGCYGGFFEYRLEPWDFAAGCLVIEEAGGRVTSCRGEPLSLQQNTILATNGRIHDELSEIVVRHHP